VTAALSRRKQAAFTAILAGFSLALCLLVAGGYYTVVGHRLHRQHQAEFAGRSFIQHDPLIGYAARPAVTMQHLTPPVFAIYTDDRGCRTDAPGQAAPTAVDLLAIG